MFGNFPELLISIYRVSPIQQPHNKCKMELQTTICRPVDQTCLLRKSFTYNLNLVPKGVVAYMQQFVKSFKPTFEGREVIFNIIRVDDKPTPPTETNAGKNHSTKPNNESSKCATNEQNASCNNWHEYGAIAMAAMESGPDMSQLINRLVTFQKWPENSLVSTVPLATFGFYYTGISDKVQCYKCLLELDRWSERDDPKTRHRRENADCPLVSDSHSGGQKMHTDPWHTFNGTTKQNPSFQRHHDNGLSTKDSHFKGGANNYFPSEDRLRTNLPQPNVDSRRYNNGPEENKGRLQESLYGERPPTKDGAITSTHATQNQPGFESTENTSNTKPVLLRSTSETLNAIVTSSSQSSENWFSLRDPNDAVTSRPLDYTVEANRLASFMGRWSSSCAVQPPELAAAGLYFTGPGDRVQCAYCRGGLYGWEQGDTAIGEHRRHFPECSFIQTKITELVSPVRPTIQQNTQPTARQADGECNRTDKKATTLKIVNNMGYSMAFLERAVEKLELNGDDMSVANLLDVVFDMENDDTAEPNVTEPQRQVNNSLPQDVIGSTSSPRDKDAATQDPTKTPDTAESLAQLSEENTRLKGKMICKVCMDEEVAMIFLPCRHMVCCHECGTAVKHCPVCRTLIVGTVKPSFN